VETKLGKFCTVSTASVMTPLQLGHAGCTGELDNAGVGSGSREWHGNQDADSSTMTSIKPEVENNAGPEPQGDYESDHTPSHDAGSDFSSENIGSSDSNHDQMTSAPTPTHHIEIRYQLILEHSYLIVINLNVFNWLSDINWSDCKWM